MDKRESLATDGRWWELDLAPGWCVASWELETQHLPPFELDRCAAIVAPRKEEVLRIYAWDSRDREQTAAQWVQVSATTPELHGAQPTSPWRSHTFVGVRANWETRGVRWSQWWLAATHIALHAMHRTSSAEPIRKRGKIDVEAMMRTVRMRALAG